MSTLIGQFNKVHAWLRDHGCGVGDNLQGDALSLAEGEPFHVVYHRPAGLNWANARRWLNQLPDGFTYELHRDDIHVYYRMLRNPHDLSKADLAAVVEQIQRLLYWDPYAGEWDANKEQDSDALDYLNQFLDDVGLRPEGE
jgi:hypothetical protein